MAYGDLIVNAENLHGVIYYTLVEYSKCPLIAAVIKLELTTLGEYMERNVTITPQEMPDRGSGHWRK